MLAVPLVALELSQELAQAIALVLLQVRVELAPESMAVGLALRLTVGGSGGTLLTVTEAVAEALPPEPVQVIE